MSAMSSVVNGCILSCIPIGGGVMKNILYIILLLSISYSQTDVSGVVSGSWTLEGSPYNVVGDIDIITTLDIEPGVYVVFQEANPLDDYTINVYGQLTANGTEENPIFI